MTLRAVLDANVFASALIQPKGASGRILSEFLRRQAFTLVLTASILAETERCLSYPRVRKRIQATDDEVRAFLHSLGILSDMVTPEADQLSVVKRDPDDDKYLAAAMEGRAEYVVTGDKDLLELEMYSGVSIVTPIQFAGVLGI